MRLATAYNHLWGARLWLSRFDVAEDACRQALLLQDRHPGTRREERACVLNLLGHIARGRLTQSDLMAAGAPLQQARSFFARFEGERGGNRS